MAYDYQLIRIDVADRVLAATIDNPPINLMTFPLFLELARLADEAAADDGVGAVVLQSANPDFFIAHFDVEALLGIDITAEPQPDPELGLFQRMCETYRTMPKATIAKIAGRVGGGGAELSASFDMRFGAVGRAVVNQMEVGLGIIPGGTGTQRIPRLVGRARAMEIVLGSVDIDAETAERWGWLNRALPAADLDRFVDVLARRIASFPPEAVALAKQSVLNAELPVKDGLLDESHLFQQTLRLPAAQDRMRRFLEVGGQTKQGELRVADLIDEL